MSAGRRSIRVQLTWIIMLISGIAILLVCMGSVIQDVIDEREDLDMHMLSSGKMIGANTEAPLMFNDPAAAAVTLSGLRTHDAVFAACIYKEQGTPFATYSRGAATVPAHISGREQVVVRGKDRVELFLPIIRDGERVGTVYIAADQRARNKRMKEDAVWAAIMLLVCLLVAYGLSWWLQGSISRPIVELARVASLVSESKNFGVRVRTPESGGGHEISDLMTGFNSMLAELEKRDAELVSYQTQLETTVAMRTAELTTANQNLVAATLAAEKAAGISAQLARESSLILNSATDGIFGVDIDGEPSFLNPAGQRMLGRSLEELRGKSIHALIHHSRADGTRLPETGCPLGQALLQGKAFAVSDDTFWRPDGSSFPVEYSATPMLDEDGRKLGAVVMFRDVTERKEVDRLKSEFVSTVSHELRTPLTSIRGALGLLGSGLLGPLAEKGQRMLEMAILNTDRLVRLINDILELERSASGKVKLARGPVDATAAMSQAAEGLRSIAEAAAINVVIVPVTATLWGDSDRIIQTLTNLLGNAIKFSPAGTTVTLRGDRVDGEFTFCVADHGRGVPEENLESIFERFAQVDASDSRDKGGSGLGLAISKSIVHAHGGRIWAERNDPLGTRIQFTIPLASSLDLASHDAHQSQLWARPRALGGALAEHALEVHQTLETADASEVQTVGAVPGIQLLVIDDEENIREIVQTGLQLTEGWTVMTATGGVEGAAMASVTRPDAIVLDVMMPGMDGPRTLLALQAKDSTKDIPVIFLTAKVQPNERQRLMRLGVRGIIAKPFDPLTLGQQVKDLLRWSGNVPASREARPPVTRGKIADAS
jgi:PAS domain S-box-containing protein